MSCYVWILDIDFWELCVYVISSIIVIILVWFPKIKYFVPCIHSFDVYSPSPNKSWPNISHDTVEHLYNTVYHNKILHTESQWKLQALCQSMNSQKTHKQDKVLSKFKK